MTQIINHIKLWLQRETVLITDPNPLIVLAVILLTGYIFSRLARKIRIPTVTGQIIGGVFIGHYVLNIFHESAFSSFESITNFALGGIFTKTLLAVVAINNVLTIFVFYIAYYFLYYKFGTGHIEVFATFEKAFILLLESLLIGGFVGFALIYATEKRKIRSSFMALVILAIVITVGTSEFLHLSGILSSLILGIIITNFSRYRKTLFSAFKDIEVEVFTLFFVLAGTHLDLTAAKYAGAAGLILIVTRLIGKTLAPTLGSIVAGSIQTIRKNIGLALYPIAGVAIGLILSWRRK